MEATLLTLEQVDGDSRLNIFDKVGINCLATDFANILNGEIFDLPKNRYFLNTKYNDYLVYSVHKDYPSFDMISEGLGIRPVISIPSIINKSEVELGSYPQNMVDVYLESNLEKIYQSGNLRKTGKTYTTSSTKIDDRNLPFQPCEHEEYEYNGKKYVRIVYYNSLTSKQGIYFWLEVSPLKWYVDSDAKILISKNIIASGVRFCDAEKYDGNFKNTEMYKFLNNYFLKDLNIGLESKIIEQAQERIRKK